MLLLLTRVDVSIGMNTAAPVKFDIVEANWSIKIKTLTSALTAGFVLANSPNSTTNPIASQGCVRYTNATLAAAVAGKVCTTPRVAWEQRATQTLTTDALVACVCSTLLFVEATAPSKTRSMLLLHMVPLVS
jgi:hypothetical protein